MRILVIGGGGREHATGAKLTESRAIKLFFAPGNGGTSEIGTNVPIDIKDFAAIVRFCRQERIELIVVGPEQPLVDGLVDYIDEHAPWVQVFGPSEAAARLEGSKAFCKDTCAANDIPTAPYMVATTMEQVEEALRYEYLVVKADGLCAGKGVAVAKDAEEARAAAKAMLDGKFGDAGRTIVMEKRLYGRECSIMAFVDGENADLMLPSRDYKRAYDGDDGPNTGGMGAYAPLPDVNEAMLTRIKSEIVDKLVLAMKRAGTPYRGVMYVGIMITEEGDPCLLEVNCRFGDPETEVVLALLDFELLTIMFACIKHGGLSRLPPLRWKNGFAVDVVKVARNYPDSSPMGDEIVGLDEAKVYTHVFHAGTERDENGVMRVKGGRVINLVGTGPTLEFAREQAYRGEREVYFSGGRCRTDIALV